MIVHYVCHAPSSTFPYRTSRKYGTAFVRGGVWTSPETHLEIKRQVREKYPNAILIDYAQKQQTKEAQ